ncbi:cytochrome c1 [Alphaproteobacteria bacterium KMM 3653]|uniref:Cytochrome c1 n=1 Tax=Harenicola maris TaxID=2841044 RepID=A0AAP2CP65_9RHOB|nr:cytochrome c1 [Harenicola maris]
MTFVKSIVLASAAVVGLSGGAALAAGGEAHVHDYDFSFEGPFGTYDQMQLQRGLQVYTEICSSCHGLRYVPIRTLSDEGGPQLPEDQVRAYAAQFPINDELSNNHLYDAENDVYGPLKETDNFPAVLTDGNGYGPDLSLMAKARAGFHGPYGTGINQMFKGMGGAEYIASLLAGYEEAPSCAPDDMDGSYNAVFASGGYPEECIDEDGNHMYPGSWISMGQPIYDDSVEYADGAPADVEAIAQDVAAFLMWTAEPKMMARKQTGLVGVLFLGFLTVLLYLTNKRIWAPVKGKGKAKA